MCVCCEYGSGCTEHLADFIPAKLQVGQVSPSEGRGALAQLESSCMLSLCHGASSAARHGTHCQASSRCRLCAASRCAMHRVSVSEHVCRWVGSLLPHPGSRHCPLLQGQAWGRQGAAGIGFGTAAGLQHECVLVPHAAVNLVLAFLPTPALPSSHEQG